MSEDEDTPEWMRPSSKPLPGPVPNESLRMSKEELARVVRATDHADSFDR